MIVYGSPARDIPLAEMVAEVTDLSVTDTLDGLRSFLIACGQLEQAIADENLTRGMQDAARALTDAAAVAFVAAWSAPRTPHESAPLPSAVRHVACETAPYAEQVVRVVAPEGFAFYTLYPEQYIEAALQWSSSHPRAARVLVLGVRSIGTTLSAVVAATLSSRSIQARRMTVRPTGHPFNRTAEISGEDIEQSEWALIVDEGPGASGSSVAACAEALVSRGFNPDRIAFLPGHAGMPGSAASAETMRWWKTTARFVVPLPDMRWQGRSLPEVLADSCAAIGVSGQVTDIHDLGGGLWRQHVYPNPADYPATATPFERSKYLCRIRTPDGPRSVLWKFAGVGAAEEKRRMATLAAAGWSNPPLGESMGFVAREWLDGAPLTRGDADSEVARAIGRYVWEARTEPADLRQRVAALGRISHMAYHNTLEGLGKESAESILALAGRLDAASNGGIPGYGDGRLDPHEWIREPGGRLARTDCAGHDRDHTCVGWQPVWWDLAGALVEWGQDGELERELMDSYAVAGGQLPPPEALAFYHAAYCAFRMGLSRFCASCSDVEEANRHLRDYERYRNYFAARV